MTPNELRQRLRETPAGLAVRRARRRYRQLPHQQAKALDALRERWHAEGEPLPPPNELKVAEVVSYAKRGDARVFIETGTYLGETLSVVKDHVARAWSIELSPELAARARITFARDAHVEIVEGDSGEVLPALLAELREPALFWLDGHWSMGETARGSLDTPVRAELEAVLTHACAGHVVLIDDARLFGTGDYPSVDDVRALVAKHRPDWRVDVALDIIRAHA